jgi:hypothetical protein
MTAKVINRVESRIDIGEETAKFALNAFSVVSVLIGIWGMACLVGGLAASGAGGLVHGYIAALTGM